ncbi:MAG: YkgJ family cysteine cluster protein [Chloroflexi bacterium]|nr:YkgJ family cysteine cluster protein [Chloroflexota bacterium]
MRVSLRTFNGDEYSPNEESLPIECFRCGVCCIGYYPQLSVEEVDRIAGNLHISADEFISKYVQVTQIGYLLQQTEYGCVFLDWEKNGSKARCIIHPFRPDACRNWAPSLFRRECREGLVKLRKDSDLLQAGDIYEDPEQLKRFYASLKADY